MQNAFKVLHQHAAVALFKRQLKTDVGSTTHFSIDNYTCNHKTSVLFHLFHFNSCLLPSRN